MTKTEFLDEIKKNLVGLSDEDIARSLDYYSEMIDDRIEDGTPEDEAVAELGTPEAAAKEILMDMPIAKVVKAKIKKERKLSGGEIALIIIGAPLWIPILIALFAVVFAVFITLWAVLVSLYAVVLALAFSGLACVGYGIFTLITGAPSAGLFSLGAGAASVGVGSLLLIGTLYASKGLVWICKKFGIATKKLFIR